MNPAALEATFNSWMQGTLGRAEFRAALLKALNIETDPLSPGERRLCAAVLGMAADTFSNHGCNDFDLREVIPSLPERNAVVRAEREWAGEDPDEYPDPTDPDKKDWRLGDWVIMRYLAAKLTRPPLVLGSSCGSAE